VENKNTSVKITKEGFLEAEKFWIKCQIQSILHLNDQLFLIKKGIFIQVNLMIMGPLFKVIGAVSTIIVGGVVASVLSKNDEDRKEWLNQMGDHIDDAFDKVGDFIDNTVDKVKESFQ